MTQCPSRVQMASLSLIVLKKCRIIGRGSLQAFWWVLCLREGKEVASQLLSWTAFLKAAQKSLIGLREAALGGLALETNFICCCKSKGVICYVGLWANEVRGK